MLLLRKPLLTGAGIWDAERPRMSEHSWQAQILLPVELECRAVCWAFASVQ